DPALAARHRGNRRGADATRPGRGARWLVRPLLALLLATAAHAKAQYSGAAMPLTSYSSDTGLGFGARAFARRLGDGEELPVKLEAQAFGTTYGQQFHFASLEVPHAFGTRMRLELLGGY